MSFIKTQYQRFELAFALKEISLGLGGPQWGSLPNKAVIAELIAPKSS